MDLPEELSQIHNNFHVSHLRCCIIDESTILTVEDTYIDGCLSNMEKPVVIIDKIQNLMQQGDQSSEGGVATIKRIIMYLGTRRRYEY